MKEAELGQFIYRFLILNGSVNLPGFGSLEILHLPAINELNKQQISSPSSVIKFRNDESVSESSDLIKYLVRHLNISEPNAIERFSSFCRGIKNEIEFGSVVSWSGLGKFSKSFDGLCVFENQYPDITLNEVVANAPQTNMSADFHTVELDDLDTGVDHADEDQSTFFVEFKTAVIILTSIILILLIIRYSFGGNDLFGSRYQKVHFINPPSTYKENIK